MTIVAVATQKADLYCESSLNPAFAHIWVRSISVLLYDQTLTSVKGPSHRVYCGHYCDVLPDTILYPDQG